MVTYDLKKDKKTPLYLGLYDNLREDIRAGVLRAGERLPSKRTLAEHLGVSVVTVDAAYKLLIDEGYAVSRERSGYFVAKIAPGPTAPARAGKPARAVKTKPPADLGFRFSSLTKLMREVITEYGERLLMKPTATGCRELREAIAGFLLRYRGMRAEPERIVVGSGAEYLYGMLVQLLGREKLYAVEDPGYMKIRRVYAAQGARVTLLPLEGDGVASAALADCGADVLHVTPYHSYPTGITASAEKRREYLSWASMGERVVVEDDFDSEFALTRRPQETLFSMDGGERVVYLNTFSHSLAPSMRMGYMVLPERLMEEYEEKLGFYACSVPLFDQYVLAEFIDRGLFERHLNRVRRKLRNM